MGSLLPVKPEEPKPPGSTRLTKNHSPAVSGELITVYESVITVSGTFLNGSQSQPPTYSTINF